MQLISIADSFLNGAKPNVMKNNLQKVGGLLFFEPSTRTRIGFEVAAWKLGIKTVFLEKTKPSKSTDWVETISDTIKTMNAFVDYYFIRHPSNEIFNEIVPHTALPVINCGNGYDEHPTQAIIDAYAIYKKFNTLDDLTITFIGDVRYSRAAHSLILLLRNFNNIKINIISPAKLGLQNDYLKRLSSNIEVRKITKLELGKEDILYSSGFAPINPSGTFSQEIIKKYAVTLDDVKKLNSNCIIMNPLPRIDEIDLDVDDTKNAYYFRQNELSLYARMAIIDLFCRQ